MAQKRVFIWCGVDTYCSRYRTVQEVHCRAWVEVCIEVVGCAKQSKDIRNRATGPQSLIMTNKLTPGKPREWLAGVNPLLNYGNQLTPGINPGNG